MRLRWTMAGAVLAVGMASGLGAQPRLPKVPKAGDQRQLAPDRGRNRGPDDVPAAYRPPPGMCRIWLDNVAPAQQPAPTDCNSAVRNRPANARVLFGDDYASGRGGAAADLAGAGHGGTAGVPTLASRWAPAIRYLGGRPHGPAAEEATEPAEPATPDSAARTRRAAADGARGAAAPGPDQPPVSRPVARPGARRTDVDDEGDLPPTRDDWEAGYAAGYRDAMNNRRPRVRGVGRAGGGSAETARGTGLADERYAPGNDGAAAPLVVVPSGADVDPRYFNNGRFPPPGRANGVCLDRDGDGWCDDPRFGAPVCRDLDGDGRCDDYPALAAAPLPATLPEMRAGLDVRTGAGSATALRWLGTSEVTARVTSSGRGGAPSRVVWLDANTGALLQVWTDRDADGVADRVELYRGGRRVKLIGR